MDTLTQFHLALEDSLGEILDRIEDQAREAVWNIEEMYYFENPFKPIDLTSTCRSYDEQRRLYERWRQGKGINYSIPGHEAHHMAGLALDRLDSLPQQMQGALWEYDPVEPWHFEYLATKRRYGLLKRIADRVYVRTGWDWAWRLGGKL